MGVAPAVMACSSVAGAGLGPADSVQPVSGAAASARAAGSVRRCASTSTWPLITPFLLSAYPQNGMQVTLSSRFAFKNEPFE